VCQPDIANDGMARAYPREATTIKKGRYSAQIITAHCIVARDADLVASAFQRKAHNADAVDTGRCVSTAQLKGTADQRKRSRSDFRAGFNWHRGSG
jgi:hypothetical protein